MQQSHLRQLADNPRFHNLRQTGTIAAMDIKVSDAGYLANISLHLYDFFQKRGLLLRPLGNTVYVLPPYCITEADLDEVYALIAQAAEEVAAWA